MKSAIKHNYLVLKYQFLFDSVEKLTKMPSAEYVVQLPEVRAVLTKEKPVQKKHFGQHKTMSSLVKKSRKYKICLSKRKTARKPVNIAVFYALKNTVHHPARVTVVNLAKMAETGAPLRHVFPVFMF